MSAIPKAFVAPLIADIDARSAKIAAPEAANAPSPNASAATKAQRTKRREQAGG